MKKILLIWVLSSAWWSLLAQNEDYEYQEELNIIKEQFKEINNGEGYTETNPFTANDDCHISIRLKKKGDEIKMIEVRRYEDTRSFVYQFYYWDDIPFFIYTRNDINEGGIFRVSEYRHYFAGYKCFRTLYKGFRYKNVEPKIKNMEFMDYSKAYEFQLLAEQLLDAVKQKDWKKVCELNFPI